MVLLKGLCHGINDFFVKVLKSNQYLLYMRKWFKYYFFLLVMENIEDKALVASMRTLSNCENPSSNPLQKHKS